MKLSPQLLKAASQAGRKLAHYDYSSAERVEECDYVSEVYGVEAAEREDLEQLADWLASEIRRKQREKEEQFRGLVTKFREIARLQGIRVDLTGLGGW